MMSTAMVSTASLFFSGTTPRLFATGVRARISNATLNLLSSSHLSSSSMRGRFLPPVPCSAVQDIAVEEEKEENTKVEESEEEEEEKRRKLYVVNLPWNFPAPDIEKLFGECGTVKDVEIIKQKNGKNRGFAFITMASGDEAQAAIAKFDSFELMGRIIRVEYAKSFRKPSPPPPPGTPPKAEGQYKIYASNLAWKARATNLRDVFSEKFKPLSARVVFDSPKGRSAGYGFVGFATLEEAEAAVSELDGKELMGRPLRLKISQQTGDKSAEGPEEANYAEQESPES